MPKPTPFRWPLQCHPDIRIVARAPFAPDAGAREYRHATFALHQHFYHGSLILGGKVIALRPGDLTISPPEIASRYKLAGAGFHWCVHFQPVPLHGVGQLLRLPLHIPMHGAGGAISERMREIFETSQPARKPKASLALTTATISSLFQSLLLHLALVANQPRPARQYKRRSDSVLDAIKLRIDEEFHRRPFEVADLARESKLSRNYFSARFHERFGMTVDACLLHRRIEMARTLLISTSLSMKEIAFECGIPDPHYFNKQFRHVAGMSPSAYRAENS